jgi:large subunit ribosomal protein L4
MTVITTPTPDTLDVSLFGIVPHLDVLSRLMLLQSHNGRFPIAHTKSRSARRGSTRKLTKQKGAGASRKGSNRSPSRKGGGVAFGPRSNANFHIGMNAGERRLGLASALTLKNQEGKIRVLDSIDPKTAVMAKTFGDIIEQGTALVFVSALESKQITGLDNIHGTHVDVVTHASPAEILKYDYCIFTKDALKSLSEHFISENA